VIQSEHRDPHEVSGGTRSTDPEDCFAQSGEGSDPPEDGRDPEGTALPRAEKVTNRFTEYTP